MAQRLKVFRTPIGFHDAYVAAPSQKAALKAWGAGVNLFARGAAEQVTDPTLMEEALANPGKVIRRRRASAAEHFASLDELGKTLSGRSPRKAKDAAPPKPRPSREALDAAEQALANHRQRAQGELSELEDEQARILARIRQIRQRGDRETARLTRALERERRRHNAALKQWRSS